MPDDESKELAKEIVSEAMQKLKDSPEHIKVLAVGSEAIIKAIDVGRQAERTRLLKEELERHLEWLAFVQDQMEVRRSDDESKIGRDERMTTEYLTFNMCWQEYLRTHFGLYPTLDSKVVGTGKNQKLWIIVEEYRENKDVQGAIENLRKALKGEGENR